MPKLLFCEVDISFSYKKVFHSYPWEHHVKNSQMNKISKFDLLFWKFNGWQGRRRMDQQRIIFTYPPLHLRLVAFKLFSIKVRVRRKGRIFWRYLVGAWQEAGCFFKKILGWGSANKIQLNIGVTSFDFFAIEFHVISLSST